MPDVELVEEKHAETTHTKGRHFMRFTREQRYLHAALFTSFLGLAGTGLPLRFMIAFIRKERLTRSCTVRTIIRPLTAGHLQLRSAPQPAWR